MSKKIQIRSFVKGGNHGQYLQALGLHEYIKSIFPETEVSHLDYNNHAFKEFKIQLKSGHLPKFLSMSYYWNKRVKFTGFQHSPDISIYGSDMIWHQGSPLFPPDKIFFGEKDTANAKIAFAPSVAARNSKEGSWIKNYLRDFKKIGVRDMNTKQFVYDNAGLEVPYVIDPCFLLLGSKYEHLIKSDERKDFVSVYSPTSKKLLNLFYKNLDQEHIPEFCKNIDITGYFRRVNFFKEFRKQLKDPLWTVKRIAESKLLLTSTFHGVMMALMTKTPFIAISSPNLEARLNSPISKAFAHYRLLSLNELEKIDNNLLGKFLTDIDIDQDQLNKYLEESKVWLKDAISESINPA